MKIAVVKTQGGPEAGLSVSKGALTRQTDACRIHVGAGALTCPAERSSAIANSAITPGISTGIRRPLLILATLALLSTAPVSSLAQAEPAEPASQQQSATPKQQADQPDQHHPGVAGELVEETREAAGEEEENASLKHAKPIQWLAHKIGWSVHNTHLLLSGLNFAIIAVVFIWAMRKFLPGFFRTRNQAIQQALQEARAASQDANRRLADIENRLRQLDVEIGQMQAAAEKEAVAEEARIQKAGEEELQKVALAAKHEIAAAAKQARRELAAHTASLAVALASKQINVDTNTDQVLVRSFASKLASGNNGGKDGQ
ncbi:MAG TPA: ATP synthase F0 subunit B [Terriglobales bacterium]|jgi:F-type H+-transporting ATPase subunit b|nr:ATP synthase F0 subunit B [Terriglobales bacterium]